MPGPEEWSSRRKADRIRLTGPAATKFCLQLLTLACGCGAGVTQKLPEAISWPACFLVESCQCAPIIALLERPKPFRCRNLSRMVSGRMTLNHHDRKVMRTGPGNG